MFHLFNKVYLKHESAMKMTRDRIVISSLYGAVDTASIPFSATTPSSPVYRARSIEQLLNGHFDGSMERFFTYLLGLPADRRMTIYCDVSTAMTILTFLWKTMYVSEPVDTYMTLRRLHLMHLLEGHASGAPSFVSLEPPVLVSVRASIEEELNRNDAADIWASVQPMSLTRTQREQIIRAASIELQLATTLATPKWRYSMETQHKFIRMLKKQCVYDFLLDVKYHVLGALFCFSSYEPTTTFDPMTQTVDDLVALHPEYSFLTDPMFHYDNIDYVVKTYSLDHLRTIWAKTIRDGWSEDEYGFNVGQFMRDDLSFQEVIQHFIDHPQDHLPLTRGEYRERVNGYLLNAIFDSLRTDGNLARSLSLR